MLVRNRVALVAATALTCAGLVAGTPATADTAKKAETPATVKVVAKNLSDPRQISSSGDYFYVAESGLNQIARVTKAGGARKTVVKGVPNAQGVVKAGSKLYMAAGAGGPGAKETPASQRLHVAKPGQSPRVFANLLKFEQTYNPDNQTQGTGPEDDTLSNPYFVVKSKSKGGFLLVADAGANDVLAVSKKGKVSRFFVPQAITTGDCATNTDQNSPAGPSCDPVPTGLAYGPGGLLYVSGLSSEAEGEGRVYVVDKNGKLVKTLTGFTSPTGVAVAPDGTIYVSEAIDGAPEGDPGPGFNPDEIGQIVKVAPDGKRTYAQVSQPSGLLYLDGKLYASARSLYKAFLGAEGQGQIVTVDPSSFVAE